MTRTSTKPPPAPPARRTAPVLSVLGALAAAAFLTGCGGGEPAPQRPAASEAAPTVRQVPAGRTPFTGTWHSGRGAGSEGGTTLTVAADGSVQFQSSLACTGAVTAAPDGRTYRFSIDCGTSKFSGAASSPGTAPSFVLTWDEGDSSEFHAAS